MGGMSEEDWMGGFSYYFAQPAAASSFAGEYGDAEMELSGDRVSANSDTKAKSYLLQNNCSFLQLSLTS